MFWKIGQTEEGRDQVVLAIADEATIKQLDKYKAMLASLADPRKTTDEQARELIKTGKPIYWINSGIHSPETGGPEMLIELAYRLIVEETPFIQAIRNNVIVFITPVIEVDGREKQVDTYYYGKKTGKQRPPLMYWGKYVAHDNNRDGMGQYLKLTQNITKTLLEWHPTILHDLHEAQSYLYVSTGTGPYNNSLDPIQVNEWWLLAETEIMEMAKRGVPGVWTYGFYDGWVPNYLFWIAMTHNSFGRFYEVQSYGPDIVENLRLQPTVTSREWFRPNPPLPSIKWGPRNNTNIQESALLFALHQVAQNKELYLENYWMKNKRAVEKGKAGPTYAWVIPAGQRRKADAADFVNELRHQGLEIHTASSAFKAGSVDVAAGDYIVRADQPYRTLADMYFSVQNYPPANPRPYDDTGWTMQFMRNVKLTCRHRQGASRSADDAAHLGRQATRRHRRSGQRDRGRSHHRQRSDDLPVQESRREDAGGRGRFRAHAATSSAPARSSFRTPIAPASSRRSGNWDFRRGAVASPPNVKTHDLDMPRIGYVHSWQRTQDEGWVRAALDYYGVPYTYFADQKLREGNLRAKYDVIIYPHVGGIIAIARQRDSEERARSDSVQEIRTHAESRRARPERRYSRRHGNRRIGGARQIRPGGRHADHGRIHCRADGGLRPGGRRHRGASGAAFRARLDFARHFARPKKPDRVWIRGQGSAGVLQSGSGVQRRRRWLWGIRRRWWRRRRRPERHAQCRAVATLAAGSERYAEDAGASSSR